MLLIYTGSYPNDKCGVGDYVYNLGVELSKYTQCKIIKLSLLSLLKLMILNRGKIELLNIQYPSIGFATSKFSAIRPHLAFLIAKTLGLKTSITLHEFSSLSAKAKKFTQIFMMADFVIFTTEYEKQVGEKYYFSKEKTRIIPIASNIPTSATSLKHKVTEFDIVHFGIISEGKGIEDFIWVLNELNSRGVQFKAALIGYIPETQERFAKEILHQCSLQNCTTLLNQSSEDIAEYLSKSNFAILPYPDGISERRGSALAAMANGALVFSFKGRFSAEFSNISVLAQDKNDLLEKVLNYLDNRHLYEGMIERAFSYSETRNWSFIAQKYKGLYSDDSDK